MLIHEIMRIYGHKPMCSRGKVHDYLGMDLGFSKEYKVKISMVKCTKKIIVDFLEETKRTSSTPAANHLFKVKEDGGKKLPEEQVQAFQSTVAQLLFLCERTQPDIRLPVSFLTKWVQEPDEDNWGKLKRVLKYLKGTMYMKLVLSAESLNSMEWCVDASYGTHWDLKGHTVMVMSLGKGGVMSASRLQKIKSCSSMEVYLVGIDYMIPKMMWSMYFLEAQGYIVEQNILYQDISPPILLAFNGRMSSSKRPKYIRHRYFLIKDRIEQGELEVKYCPTTEMWADIMTETL